MARSTLPRHRSIQPLAHMLPSVHDPVGFISVLPPDLRCDPGFICEALGMLVLSSNTTELSRRMGMSRMGLRKAFEPGGNPSFTTVVRAADALGLKLELVAA